MPKKATNSRASKQARALETSLDSKAKTIVYVHGLANKPREEVLKRQWDRALFGFDLGERSRMAYWVNRTRYGAPLGETADPDEIAAMQPKPGFSTAAVGGSHRGVDSLIPTDASETARPSLTRLRDQLLQGQADPAAKTTAYHSKVLPLPSALRGWVMRQVTEAFLADANDFFFDTAERARMRESLIARLRTGGGPFVIIGHSQGSMIAYDVLSNWDQAKLGPIEVSLFVTIGSPLGLAEVQDRMKELTGQKRLGVPATVKRWLNFADAWDFVALDKRLAGDYTPKSRITDVAVDNPVESNPHSGIGYLSVEPVRHAVVSNIRKSLFQKVSEFTVSRDLVAAMASEAGKRHPVLIELQDRPPYSSDWLLRDGGRPENLEAVTANRSREQVVAWVLERVRKTLALESGADSANPITDEGLEQHIDLEKLESFVSARLTRPEVEELASTMRGVAVFKVFKNSAKRRHLTQSLRTIQARTAHLGYDALGQGITWAVLDTGVDGGHPHFQSSKTIEHIFDCVKTGAIKENAISPDQNVDADGHGTHVAGIISGEYSNSNETICGVAPRTKLWCYKVLGDNGEGSDAKIIKALDHIYRTNRGAADLRIHGVNLSLGGGFDPESFGCGDTPLCKELRKLWRQGVVVVISAGNEGQVDLPDGSASLNTYMSIGDPANLDEAVVVGSVHATKPHMYGVSYFSSRGPTADGRAKPDVVAPGEKILSCRASELGSTAKTAGTLDELYTRMSGTSMAAPHVSGLLACFLSARREFIGHPDRIKRHLLDNCTDLERDARHQGRGLVNLVKMLINT
ncbi:MAG TPA: S8 family peptidase [Verrucomicrobiota bacterium]|nr:hypothetical protein [Verrucomicrobiales bacterium]HRI14995.1 S8 family peptidase [Verrucomicrobiota bacterium]